MLYELHEKKAPYWFNNEEVARIQELNLEYVQQKDIAEMVEICFRRPKEGEKVKSISTTEILRVIQSEYPSVDCSLKTKAALGRAMRNLNYIRKDHNGSAFYKAVPRKVA